MFGSFSSNFFPISSYIFKYKKSSENLSKNENDICLDGSYILMFFFFVRRIVYSVSLICEFSIAKFSDGTIKAVAVTTPMHPYTIHSHTHIFRQQTFKFHSNMDLISILKMFTKNEPADEKWIKKEEEEGTMNGLK